MKVTSILRDAEYDELKSLYLTGNVLDLGGSRKSGYHELIKGDAKYTVVNYGDMHPGADLLFDIQERFPLEDESFDNVLSMNVLEHIFNFNNVYSEVYRVLKSGGRFVSTIPYMHHIHGSPDDYFRYTRSTLEKLATIHNFEIEELKELGYGPLSLMYQSAGGWLPGSYIKFVIKNICVGVDRALLNLNKYRELRNRIPLGYYFVFRKK
jgi:SAM-dependent methyltransferase